MKWTNVKPNKVGYYFYRDKHSDHEVVPVDFSYDGENLHYWDEFDKSWLPVEYCDPEIEWSDEPITFPEEPKKENPWVSYVKEGK